MEFLKSKEITFDTVKHVDDILFTAKATLLSNRTVPLAQAKYHYRKGHSNECYSVFAPTHFEALPRTTKNVIRFINSQNLEKTTYLTAFHRLIWRLDNFYIESYANDWSLPELKQVYFHEFCKIFKSCMYKNEYYSDYYKPYFDFLANEDFDGYNLLSADACAKRLASKECAAV